MIVVPCCFFHSNSTHLPSAFCVYLFWAGVPAAPLLLLQQQDKTPRDPEPCLPFSVLLSVLGSAFRSRFCFPFLVLLSVPGSAFRSRFCFPFLVLLSVPGSALARELRCPVAHCEFLNSRLSRHSNLLSRASYSLSRHSNLLSRASYSLSRHSNLLSRASYSLSRHSNLLSLASNSYLWAGVPLPYCYCYDVTGAAERRSFPPPDKSGQPVRVRA
eukprot:scaffold423_cov110-Isochrysis_galbana.AAC.1